MKERALSSGAVLHEVQVKVLKEGKAFLKEGNVGRKRDGGVQLLFKTRLESRQERKGGRGGGAIMGLRGKDKHPRR
jgi:hypothetical protein